MKLGSERLVLRAFAQHDDDELNSWFPGPGELRYFSNKRIVWPPSSDQWDDVRQDPTVLAWTATLSTNPVTVGHGEIVEKSPSVVGIERIAIAPAWRGRGYGRALVGALLDKAESAGYGQVRQIMHRDNTTAVRAYRAFGFRQHPMDGEPTRVLLEKTFLNSP